MTGFTDEGLEHLHQVLAGHVARGQVPSIVAAVERDGQQHVEVLGTRGPEEVEPIEREERFRITSMTKPITAVAAMLLVQDGTISLDAPIDRWLPELADRRVLRTPTSPLDDTVPLGRPVTVEDLLTFRCGLGLVFDDPPTPIQQAEADLGTRAMAPPKPATELDPDEWLRRLGTLPLMDQPGTVWRYSSGSMILGALLARAADRSLPDLFQARIFGPLGMASTAFWADEGLGPVWGDDGAGGLELIDAADGQWSRPPVFPDGAAGLVSTVDDCLAFGRMLRDGGAGLLRPEAVARMTTPVLGAEGRAAGGAPMILSGRDWGLGLSVVVDPEDELGFGVGRYGWDGGFGSSWGNDPSRGLVGVILTSKAWGSPDALAPIQDFWRAAHAACA